MGVGARIAPSLLAPRPLYLFWHLIEIFQLLMGNSKKNILIVTDHFDVHADSVMIRLRELGHNPIRFRPQDLPSLTSLTLNISDTDFNRRFVSKSETILLETIHSVWWRKPKPLAPSPELRRAEAVFAYREITYTFKSIWATLDCHWISAPEKITIAEDKVSQLLLARQLGFEIPRTLITTDPEQAIKFFDECNGRIIYKTLSGPLVYSANENFPKEDLKMVFTSLLSKEKLMEHLDGIVHAPCQFQEYIEKKLELRVTIIEDEIFVAEIDSQASEQTKIDWRHYDAPMRVKKGQLPAEIADRCFSFVKMFGLNYSAMDFIVTPDGRYVFLESNPNGQWLFIEHQVPELKMREKMAQCLIRGKSR